MAFDALLQRKIMGHFATGVTVVTTEVDGQWFGMTASAVCSLSLRPPLVLVCVEQTAAMFDYLHKSKSYALNMLSEAQEPVSTRFAMKGPKEFSDLECIKAETGAPIFSASLAYVDCRVVDILRGGDHDIFIGEIVAGELLASQDPAAKPLLYYAGKYAKMR